MISTRAMLARRCDSSATSDSSVGALTCTALAGVTFLVVSWAPRTDCATITAANAARASRVMLLFLVCGESRFDRRTCCGAVERSREQRAERADCLRSLAAASCSSGGRDSSATRRTYPEQNPCLIQEAARDFRAPLR